MKNFIQNGDVLPLLAPRAVAAGEGFQVGSLFAVATAAAASGAAVEGCITGVYSLTKVSAQAWTVGAAIYWDLSLIHISEPTRPRFGSRMPSSA